MKAITSDLEADVAWDAFGHFLAPLVPFAWLVLSEIRRDHYRRVARVGSANDAFPIDEPLPLTGDHPVAIAARTREVVTADDTSSGSHPQDASLGALGVGSYFVMPLSRGDHVFAAVECFFTETGGATKERIDAMFQMEESLVQGVGNLFAYEFAVHRTRGLRQASDLKTDFLAMAAHDLRTPITLLSGYLEIIKNRWDKLGNAEREQIAQTLLNRSKALSKLVDDLFDLALLEADEVLFDIRPFDYAALVRDVVEEVRQTWGSRWGTAPAVVVEPSAEPLQALSDEKHQKKVLSDILTNALDHSAPDRPVEIRIEVDPLTLRVTVHNYGVGIEAADVGRLFDPFARLPLPEGRKTRGSGLSLHASRLIVEALGGEIGAESVPGEGTTVTFTVPALTESGSE